MPTGRIAGKTIYSCIASIGPTWAFEIVLRPWLEEMVTCMGGGENRVAQ